MVNEIKMKMLLLGKKRRKSIKRVSSRQAVIKFCDKLLFEILKIERGNRCEICGRPNPAPHHILEKGTYPRLRFVKQNILLLCWMPCHFAIHHYTHENPAYKRVQEGIERLLGADYREQLLVAEKMQSQQNMTNLGFLRMALKQELKSRGNF